MGNPIPVPDALLVSGPNGGGMAYLSDSLCLSLSDVDCTGLAMRGDLVAWCAQRPESGSVIWSLAKGELAQHTLAGGDLDLHDLVASGRKWYVVATAANAVYQLDASWNIHRSWEFASAVDAMHLNSICMHEGRLLVSAFGRFDEHRGYKGRTRGAGLVLDVESGETVLDGLAQPHSLRSVSGELWYCDSERGELVAGAKRVRLPGYTRGLHVAEQHVYVGLSCTRNPVEFNAVGALDTAAVAILARQTLEVLGFCPLPWSEIYDIQRIPSKTLSVELLQYGLARTIKLVAAQATARAEVGAALSESRAREAEALGEVARVQRHLIETNQLHGESVARQHAQALQAQAVATEHQALVARYGELTAKHAALAESQASLYGEHQALDSKYKQLVAAYGVLVSGQQALQDDHASLASEHEALVEKYGALSSEHGVLHDAYAALSGEHQALVGTYGVLVAERSTLEESSAALAREHQQLVAYYGGLTTAHTALQDAFESLAQAYRQVLEDHAAAVAAHQVAESAVTELADRHQDLIERHAGLARANHLLGQAAAEHARVQETLASVLGSRSWRLTRPLRFVARLLRQRGIGVDDRTALRRLLARDDHRSLVEAPLLKPREEPLPASLPRVAVDRQPAKADVYVWAVIDWHFRFQRPQHLARALALRGHRVFYISNNFVDSSSAGFEAVPLGEACLYQVHLHLSGSPAIYHALPDAEQSAQLHASLARLAEWHGGTQSISVVQHPFWARLASAVPAPHLVYDCMDHHAGFENNAPMLVQEEVDLVRAADLVIVSSQWLHDDVAAHAGCVALIRNGADYPHFSRRPDDVFADPDGRRVVGYYGAIAEWFDLELVRRLAVECPDVLVLLIGHDTAGAAEALSAVPNVRLVGEVPYADLPYWLHGFDVCLLPFRVLPLTLATNPVKVYEYLSAGKPVVAVDLPEMRQFEDVVRVANDHPEFIAQVRKGLAETPGDPLLQDRRQAFARANTWGERAAAVDLALGELTLPLVSIVVVTYNNLPLTKACLESLEAFSEWPNMEIIVVDNASADATPEFLRAWATEAGHRRIILNADNRGFAAANNQGLAVAQGDYLILLNNDTYVTRGWVRGLVGHLKRDPGLGLVGPVTNNIGNEARIEVAYDGMQQMAEVARDYTARHAGERFRIRNLAFFCVAMPRTTLEQVGLLDEAFGTGFFEDDDYCRRVELAGLACACAEDVFVHHQLSASFDALKSEVRQALFERNKAIYEKKWGPWDAHAYRSDIAST